MAKKKRPATTPTRPDPTPQPTAPPASTGQETPAFPDNFWLQALALAAVTALVYASSLSNGFMIFDDDQAIRYNEMIKNPSFGKLFTSQNLGMYAPVTWTGYALVYALAGESASAFHTFSLLLHIGSVVAVLGILRLLRLPAEVGFFTALLFALHPIQVEATCWIAGQSALTFSFFYLCGLAAYVYYHRSGKGLFYGLTLLAFLLSVLAKSAAVTFPLMLLALDWYRQGRLNMQHVLAKWPFLLLSVALGFYTLQTRAAAGHKLAVAIDDLNGFDRFLMVCHSLLFYPVKILAPLRQSIFYPIEKTDGVWSVDYYLAPFALAALGWLVWKYRQKMRETTLGALWYVLPLLVMLPYFKVGTFEMRSDRYAYISSAGFLLILVVLAQKLRPALRRGILAVAAVALGFLTWKHSLVWKNEVSVFQDCVDKHPDSPLCNCNLAYGQLLNLEFEDCVKHYTRTLQLDSTYYESYNGRGQAYLELQKIPEALADFTKAIQVGIETPKLYFNRGKCLVMLNRAPEALPDLNKSLELEPNAPDAWFYRAIANEKSGNTEAALRDYNEALRRAPKYYQALVNRGFLQFNAGQYEPAIEDFTTALGMAPANFHPMILNNRANAYIKLNQPDKALPDLDKALQIAPNYTKAAETRAQVLRMMGR